VKVAESSDIPLTLFTPPFDNLGAPEEETCLGQF